MPLIDVKVVLEKYPGKGGWTFARIPSIKAPNGKSIGFQKVRGTFDHHPIENMTIMPIGDGGHFLPFNKEIRTAIGKEVGDQVHLQLDLQDPIGDEKDFLACLKDAPEAFAFYKKLSKGDQKKIIDHVCKVSSQAQQIERIVKVIQMFESGMNPLG